MAEFIGVPLKDILRVAKLLKKFNGKSYNYYSDIPALPLIYIIKKDCFYIKKANEIMGILFIDTSLMQIFYIPQSQKLTFFQLIYMILKHFSLSNYSLNINYTGLKLNQYNKYFHSLKILKDLKTMKRRLDEIQWNEASENKLLVTRKMRINEEEAVRVKLQNLIFGNIVGREDITLNEVMDEEKSSKFQEDLCFILEENCEHLGYGQILNILGEYHLVNFGIIPEKRGEGLGEYFLSEILKKCWENGICELYLTVDNSNYAAIGLYKKHGFRDVSNEASVLIKS